MFLAAVAGVAYGAYPEEFVLYVRTAVVAAVWVWENIRANPVPAVLALGSFLLTVAYHKLKGKSLRESVEVAATRVTVVPVFPQANGADESPAVRRARARTTRTQLLTDQIALENRQRKLPEEIAKAEKETCYTVKAVNDAEWKLAERRKAHDEATTKLEALRAVQTQGAAELAEIETELEKLAELV